MCFQNNEKIRNDNIHWTYWCYVCIWHIILRSVCSSTYTVYIDFEFHRMCVYIDIGLLTLVDIGY